MTDYVADDRPLAAVPRTTEAEGAAAVEAVGLRLSRPAAWWGMVILVASEATLFGCFVGTYFFLRFNTPVWPPDGIPKPKLLIPLILLGVLVSTSIPARLAAGAARAGRLGATRFFVAVILLVQAGYFAYEVHDFADQLRSFGISRDAYSSIYYTLLGADHAHVLLGALFCLWLLAKLATGFTTYRLNAVQAITWYVHAVNVLTIVVFGTLLSARA
jgi:heme/copper-type cytochrome/quinol oxidase subunit 3